MAQYVSAVTQKGQVTIPRPLRKALNIQPRDLVAFSLVDGEVRLRPIESPVLASFGAVKPRRNPEDFRELRREIEEEIAEEVLNETQ